jgi:hypothetical protein
MTMPGEIHRVPADEVSPKCWLCEKGHIIETIEEYVKVGQVPGLVATTFAKARVGRCDYCKQVLYALKVA